MPQTVKRVKKRILVFLDESGITAHEFSAATKVTNKHFSKSGSISLETAKSINSVYPNLSITWLLTGLGKMLVPITEKSALKGEPVQKIKFPPSEILMLNEHVTSQQMAKQRLAKYLATKGHNHVAFAKTCKLPVTFIRSRSNFTNQNLNLILESYPDLSLEYLITGKGPITVDPTEQFNNYNRKQTETEVISAPNAGKQSLANTVLLDVKAAASGFSYGLKQLIDQKTAQTLNLPQLKNKRSSYYAVPVEGNSMNPSIESGDLVVGQARLVYNLKAGEIAVFYHHDEGLLCKRLFWHNFDKQLILLKSDNETVGDLIVPARKLSKYIIQSECIVTAAEQEKLNNTTVNPTSIN